MVDLDKSHKCIGWNGHASIGMDIIPCSPPCDNVPLPKKGFFLI